MRHFPAQTNLDGRLFGVLLLPSWLSGSIAVGVGLAFGVGAIIATQYQSSGLRLQVSSLRFDRVVAYQTLHSAVLSNSLINNLPLFLFWSLVGVVVYLFANSLVGAARRTADLKDELGYVNANRPALLAAATEHLLVRLIVLGAWIGYTLLFINHIVPYCLYAALAGAALSWQYAVYTLLSIVIMTLAVHIHTVFLRLLLFRPRLLSRALYVD